LNSDVLSVIPFSLKRFIASDIFISSFLIGRSFSTILCITDLTSSINSLSGLKSPSNVQYSPLLKEYSTTTLSIFLSIFSIAASMRRTTLLLYVSLPIDVEVVTNVTSLSGIYSSPSSLSLPLTLASIISSLYSFCFSAASCASVIPIASSSYASVII